MAEAMEFLWAHPEEAAKLGAAAQARARECFGAEKSAKAYLTALGIEA
jgi:glycosyltransferase involved in cell wall biosynthesis